uniref:Uncharacterized protein n=1 Tax=Anguilla anguilla TaxID=7936 RepID=A0A0E9R7E3_ANGAN
MNPSTMTSTTHLRSLQAATRTSWTRRRRCAPRCFRIFT